MKKEMCKRVFAEPKESVRKIVNDFVAHKQQDKDNIESKIIEAFEQDNSKQFTIYQITQKQSRR